ncbi:MAG: ATP-grasp domain-containing protein [Leadbetterella sp.]
MNKLTTVLVFPCGAESGLEIHHALKDVLNFRLVGASAREDHARMVYENYYGDFPKIDENNFYEKLNELITKENIDLILPTHDTVLVEFAKNANKINTKVAVPGLFQAELCRSKKKLYSFFENEDFCPSVYPDFLANPHFPCYAKLDEGQGSKGAYLLEKVEDLHKVASNTENFVFMEFLPGEEITIDCFTDRHGKLQFIGPRARKRIFDGVCVNSISIPLTDEISQIAHIVSDKIGIRGSWYFQLKKNKAGDWKFLEASTKIAGNGNLFRGLGVNFPLLMVYDYMEMDVEVLPNAYTIEIDRSLNHRYISYFDYDTIYIDFDDTITKKGKVNPTVLSFVYHQKNKGKIVKLITKHIHSLEETLENLCIHEGIFDSIIHIPMESKKSEFITEKERVIFIDNAFIERREVKKALGIPTFDVDAINTLIDYRE